MAVKVVKKGKDMRRVTCPECGAIWKEQYKKGKKFTCKACDTQLQFK